MDKVWIDVALAAAATAGAITVGITGGALLPTALGIGAGALAALTIRDAARRHAERS